MSLNDKLLKAAATSGITPSEHFGVVLYEGDGASSNSINGGKYGAAANFNGSSSTIVIPNSIEQPLIFAKEFGVSMWFNLASLPTGSDEDFLISLYQEGYLDIRIKANGVIQGKVAEETTGTDRIVTSANSVISANTWYHVVWTGETNNLILYVNGSSVATGSTWNGTYYHSNAGCRIGSKSGPSYYFNGKIDQTRIFQKYLSSSEVSTLYAETVDTVTSLDPLSEDTTDTLQVLGDTSCIATYRFENNETDLSGNHNGTGTQVQYGAGRYGQAASFNNTSSSKMVIGAMNSVIPNNTTGVSFSFWVYLNTVNTGSDYDHWFVGQEDYGGSFDNGEFSVRLYEGKVYTDYAQSSSIYRQRKATTVLSTGQWYHIVATYDTSNANITEVYLNGSLQTSSNITSGGTFTTTALMQSSSNMSVGGGPTGTDGKIDQFRIFTKVLSASEVTTLYQENALVASYRFEGNANDDTRNYDGTASNVTYEYGLEFTPDFVWIKARTDIRTHSLVDSSRGFNGSSAYVIQSDGTNAQWQSAYINSLDQGGFTVSGTENYINNSSHDYVAWCWKANGGTTSSNTDGSITSTVQANTDAGFSIIKYTGTSATSQSVGHGLNSTPELIMIKNLDASEGWIVWATGFGTSNWLELNSSAAYNQDNAGWGGTHSSTVVNLQDGGAARSSANGVDYVAYVMHSVDNFSKFGSYTGNGSADGPIVETGFEPAYVMVKGTSNSGSWIIFDNKRNTTNPRTKILYADSTAAETTNANIKVDFLSNGFQLTGTDTDFNGSGRTYIYMSFAADPDTEAPAVAKSFNTVTYTGNGSTQTIDGLEFKPGLIWMKRRDTAQEHAIVNIVSGIEKHLYADLSSVEQTTTNGVSSFNDDGWTMGANGLMNNTSNTYVGWVWKADDNEPTIKGGAAKAVYKFEDNGNDVTGNNNATATSITYGTGKFNKGAIFNGTTSNFKTGSSFTGTNGGSFTTSCWVKIDNITGVENILLGRFSYTTSDKQFILRVNNGGTVSLNVYNSSGTGESITTTDTLSIDTWYHIVVVVDGTKKSLYIDGQLSKSETGTISSNSSATGFLEIGGSGHLPASDSGRLDGMMDQVRIYNGAVSDTGVAALYAETVSDNDDLFLGGPPEIVISANANAGFSIVRYEGTGSAGLNVQHGLSSAPTFIIAKTLESSAKWRVFHTALGGTKYLNLNDSYGAGTSSNVWNDFTPTATRFQVGTDLSPSGEKLIAFCFHDVSSFSKFGSYTGNGGTLNVTGLGFQPDWVLIKETDGVDSWQIYDSVRGAGKVLYPNGTNAEYAGNELSSFDSDGFTVTGNPNENNKTYIYAAFKIN